MFERRSAVLSFVARMHDLAMTILAFLVAYWVRGHILNDLDLLDSKIVSPEIYPLSHYSYLLLWIIGIWFTSGTLLGIYYDVEFRNRRELATDAAKLVGLSVLLLNTCLYLIRADDVSRAFVLTIGAIDLVFLMVGRWTLVWGGSWWRDKVRSHHHCLIVGTGPAARELAKVIEQSEPVGLRLIGFVTLGTLPKAPLAGRAYPIYTLDQAYDILKNHVVDELLCAIGPDDLERIAPLIGRCHEEGIRTRVDLGFLPQTFPRAHVERLRHVPLLTLGSAPDNEFALAAKRTADVVVSASSLIVLSPVMLAVAALVRLTSSGPVLYRQIRCGLNGRRFTLYKFRSMVADAEALRPDLEHLNEMDGAAFKIAEDPRCTPVGRVLRKFSLDELPQLWNVMRGDMSLVGPRPPLPEEVERYLPWQRRRLRMRPGLTCLWTLEGRNQLLQFDRLVQFDLAYIDNWSLWLDLKIFLKTIPRVALGRGAS